MVQNVLITALLRVTVQPMELATTVEPFTCPRCHKTVGARFYGPCDECRTELRASVRADARVIDVAEYVPKMNVTPNAVASKDDD
jgi:hypothetical protein